VLAIQGAIAPNLAGLCLVYALDLTRFLKHGTAMASKTESDLNRCRGWGSGGQGRRGGQQGPAELSAAGRCIGASCAAAPRSIPLPRGLRPHPLNRSSPPPTPPHPTPPPSVERVVQYLEPAPEAPAETAPEVLKTLPPGWPAGGAISVSKLELRYRPGLPLVLRGVSFEVAAGEKVRARQGRGLPAWGRAPFAPALPAALASRLRHG
jgi:hypothetical protein